MNSARKVSQKTNTKTKPAAKKDGNLSDIQTLYNQLPANDRKQFIAGVICAESYSGPIPRPEDFAGYEKVLPGAADRILAMAEKQSEHRQSLEKAAVYSGVENSKRGQRFAFIIALVIIVSGVFLISIDKDTTGFIMVVGSIGSLIGVFIYGRRSEIKERKEKRNQTESS